jgi:L-threonylcarbamoyladenylate synthase
LSGDLAALSSVKWPVLQSSANISDGPEARRIEDVERTIRAGVDMILDGGELPGTPSTVIDLTRYDEDRSYRIARAGALPADEIEAALA